MSKDSELAILPEFNRWIIRRDEVSLQLDPDIPENIFRKVLRALVDAEGKLPFYIGDAIVFGADKWTRGRYEQFLKDGRYAMNSLKQFARVARAIPPKRRRPELGWTFHQIIAGLKKEEDQNKFFGLAIEEQWSQTKLRRRVNLFLNKEPKNPIVGERLFVRGLLAHAPLNELGVVFLFAQLSQHLGFEVESIRNAFPDCSAKRFDAARKQGHLVTIEFEYLSRNFVDHGHLHEHCDLIVCWIHNWIGCPIEVISLKDKVEDLQAKAKYALSQSLSSLA